MSISVLTCPVVSCSVLSSPFLSCPVLSCPFHYCPALSIADLSIPILSCPFLSCPVHYCPVLSYLVLSCSTFSVKFQSSLVCLSNAFQPEQPLWTVFTVLFTYLSKIFIPVVTVDNTKEQFLHPFQSDLWCFGCFDVPPWLHQLKVVSHGLCSKNCYLIFVIGSRHQSLASAKKIIARISNNALNTGL